MIFQLAGNYKYNYNSIFQVSCILLVIGVFYPFQNLYAQNKYTVSGIITDSLTGERLIGATIKVKQLNQNGAVSNEFGFYSLIIPEGDYSLSVSYIGYKTILLAISIHKNTIINTELSTSNALNEVVIKDTELKKQQLSDLQTGINRLNISEIYNVPVLLGEKDIIKTIELLPGVKSTGDANTGFYVRGGGSDQNLILLDGAPIYNASHLFGFFSTFNSDAIKDIILYKGGMPAEYGGRLSSVLDVRMNDGNNKHFSAAGGIGLIASRIKIEGPVIKNRSSFMLSVRRTYADAFLKLSGDSALKNSSLYFYDINAKINYQFNDKNTLYLSGYFGRDNIALKNNFSTNWGNTTATVRLNHLYGSKLFSNTSLIYSSYNYTVINYIDNASFKVFSKIEDYNLKQDYEFLIKNNNKLRFGAGAIYHTIIPGEISTTQTSNYNSKNIENRYAYEFNIYLSDVWQPLTNLNIVYGIRVNNFLLTGPGTFNTYTPHGDIATYTTYKTGAPVKTYTALEPRLSASYSFDNLNSIKASFNRNTQNIHLLSNSTSGLPTDLYVMSSNNIKQGIASQVSLGYYKNSQADMFELSTEVYYKWLKNEVDYKTTAQLVANQNIESELLYGVGRAYGIEFFFKKKYGKFKGWIGYTLSRSERKFDDINNGNYFPARQDRTHDISVVNIYKLSSRWTISGVFIYGTGNAVTYPAGKYKLGGLTNYYYTERNGSRLPVNSRLDIGATLNGKQHKNYSSSWTFSVYNAYNRKNPYSVIFRDSNGNPPHTEAVETSLFGIIPSVTWNFKFN